MQSFCINKEKTTSFLTVSTAEQITEIQEDPKIVSTVTHISQMHTNPSPHPKFLLYTTSNIDKLGDRDLLISLQPPLKIFGLGSSENTGVWGVQFPSYIHIRLAETWAHTKKYFSCSCSQQMCSSNMT